MAATENLVGFIDGKKVIVAEDTGPASYTSPSTISINSVTKVLEVISINASHGHGINLDETTPYTGNIVRYKVFTGTNVEVAAGTSLTTIRIRVTVVGV